MIRPPNTTFHNALKVLGITASGGATVLLSTIASCYLAVVVEKTAHRVQYHFFPHWYDNVDFALGLDLHKKIINSNATTTTTNKNDNEDTNDNQDYNTINKLMNNNIEDQEKNEQTIEFKINHYFGAKEGNYNNHHNMSNVNSSSSSFFDNVRFGETKFEIPTTHQTNTIMATSSNENISATLQSCAMTS